jgi:hypothetical protein
MPITAVCPCGKSYSLKDDFAGKSIKCPACGGSFVVPESRRVVQADPIFDRDKFLIKQKKIAISTKYFVGDEQGQEIAFVHRPAFIGRLILTAFLIVGWIFLFFGIAAALGDVVKKNEDWLAVPMTLAWMLGFFGIFWLMAPRRHVTFYRDRGMRDRLMTVRQEFKIALVNARYTLVDAADAPLATLHKNYLYNLLRKRWYVNDLDGRPICVALEDSILLSILRRFVGPLFGLLRTNFMITTPDFQDVLGEFNRKLTLFDKYVLDLTEDPERTLDRRTALALGVMLDTGERR